MQPSRQLSERAYSMSEFTSESVHLLANLRFISNILIQLHLTLNCLTLLGQLLLHLPSPVINILF